ncbi:glycoside hydrolase [Kibdelosporangium persicum]|uniref:AMP-dependent synthetase and ligase n=1 Tax=Kibdelosporangium persicum TaxID=2698649 RepID=A0ABX2FE16_9PSEU|nr:glycoside hydrolase [Kibdelosporangium persicum]NRN69611.1 AMP-dependent synthetase and ligase [Kibdelosporangium persicum]
MRRLPVIVAIGLVLSVQVVPAAHARAAGTIDFRHSLQRIDGFGFSQAFQRAALMHGARGLSPQKQREVLDLLLSRTHGAGLSILRLGIGSSADNPYDRMLSIQPVDPGGPAAPPKYVWDGDDGGQVWLAKEAKAYGVTRFYADAWSAPGYMKDNGDDANGGTLCGLQGTSCTSGDWRRAYADYLVQYTRFYAQEGITITDLGFTNEPEWTTSYASMRLTPAQAVEFTKVLGPRVQGTQLKLVCCDAAGWSQQREYTAAIEADPVARDYITTHAGHPYRSPVDGPLPTDKHTWMSEWSPNGTTWNEAWDDNSGYDGFAVAQNIHDTLTTGEANGYVFWFGASLGATRGLIQLDDGTNGGDSYRVSKRLWALASYSRFIRPDAVRVQAATADTALKVSAYRNADGSRVVEILNTATTTVSTDFTLDIPGRPRAYVTDTTRSLTATDAVRVQGKTLSAQLAPRSLTTVVLR